MGCTGTRCGGRVHAELPNGPPCWQSVWLMLSIACHSLGTTLCILLCSAFTCVTTELPAPLPQTLTKESHFFSGALGRASASSRAAYRSYFPTVLRRWWVEAVKRCGKVGAAAGCALVLLYCCATYCTAANYFARLLIARSAGKWL